MGTPNPNSLANLRRGNPGNKGRPKAAVRARYLEACDKSYVCDVAAGKRVVDGGGKKLRKPTHAERMEAYAMCLRFGLGTEAKQELAGQVTVQKAYVECSPSEIGTEE